MCGYVVAILKEMAGAFVFEVKEEGVSGEQAMARMITCWRSSEASRRAAKGPEL